MLQRWAASCSTAAQYCGFPATPPRSEERRPYKHKLISPMNLYVLACIWRCCLVSIEVTMSLTDDAEKVDYPDHPELEGEIDESVLACQAQRSQLQHMRLTTHCRPSPGFENRKRARLRRKLLDQNGTAPRRASQWYRTVILSESKLRAANTHTPSELTQVP